MAARIRVLLPGLTIGRRVYKAGELLDTASHALARDLVEGKRLIGGQRVLEYVSEAGPKHLGAAVGPEAAEQVTEAADGPDQVPSASTAEAPPSELTDLILTMLAEGQSKNEIKRVLRARPEFTERQILAEFERLVSEGRVVKGAVNGDWVVVES